MTVSRETHARKIYAPVAVTSIVFAALAAAGGVLFAAITVTCVTVALALLLR